MVTNNFWRCLSALVYQNNDGIKFKNYYGNDLIADNNGYHLRVGNVATPQTMSPNMYKVRTSLSGDGGVIFGTNDTPATASDYKLSGEIISGITASVAKNKNVDAGNGVATLSAIYTITNGNSDAITIKEVGLIANAYSSSGNASAEYKCLIERTVLNEPVTIPAGGVGQVVYTITLNYPTAT